MSGIFGKPARSLPQTAPLFNGKRHSYQGGWGNPNTGVQYLDSGSPAKRARGYSGQGRAPHDQSGIYSKLTSTPVSDASTASPWAQVEPLIKFELYTPPTQMSREHFAIGQYATVADLWTPEHIIFTVATVGNMRSKSKTVEELTKRVYENDSDLQGPVTQRAAQGIVSTLQRYAFPLTLPRLNYFFEQSLRPSPPTRMNGAVVNAEPRLPYPSVSDVIVPINIAGISNNEMATRDKRGPYWRQHSAEGAVINLVASGKTGLLSPVTPATQTTLDTIFIIFEYARHNSGLYQTETDNQRTLPAREELIMVNGVKRPDPNGNKGKIVQVRSFTKLMDKKRPWCLPSLKQMRSKDANGAVQLSRVFTLGHYHDTRRIRKARQGGLPSLDHSEYALSGSNLINAYIDIRPFY